MSSFLSINNRKIGEQFPPYIIAEMSANHNGDIKNAYKIIEMSKAAGADCVKLQTYKPETLTIDSSLPDFQLNEGLWSGQTLFELYEGAFMPWEWHKPLFEYANKIGITIFSSPFDNTAVDLLEDLNSPAYKIASFEAIDIPLIRYVASTGKPLIISTGMANLDEINEAIEVAKENGCKEIAILHCVSAYPAPSDEYNLSTLKDMKERFNLVTGLSDHTVDNITALTSIPLGASIIEKHVTLDRNGGGPDDSFSLEFKDLESLCKSSFDAWKSIGNVNYERKTSEQINIKFRRSLYFVTDINKGEILTHENVRSIRPGFGLPPKYLDEVLGKRVKFDIKAGTPVDWKLLLLNIQGN